MVLFRPTSLGFFLDVHRCVPHPSPKKTILKFGFALPGDPFFRLCGGPHTMYLRTDADVTETQREANLWLQQKVDCTDDGSQKRV